jgi:indolepyruvate ferredoxin oxidoreductase beta subunit
MNPFNIYLTGVGGQGIGLLSEILLRAADHAGYSVKAVDTHGLAQRGGIVVSQIRIGDQVHTPLVPTHAADLVVSLERHEALRALNRAARDGGTLIYYNTVWQPLDVRLGAAAETTGDMIQSQCQARKTRLIEVFEPDLPDTRMQNIAILSHIHREHLIPGIDAENYRQAMEDLMAGAMLQANMELFESLISREADSLSVR